MVAGIGAGSWSALVALALPQLGKLFDRHHFGVAFILVALAPVVGTILWWLLVPASDASRDFAPPPRQ